MIKFLYIIVCIYFSAISGELNPKQSQENTCLTDCNDNEEETSFFNEFQKKYEIGQTERQILNNDMSENMHYLVELNEMNRQIKMNGLANISTSQYRNSSDMDVNITKPIMSCLPSTIQSPIVEIVNASRLVNLLIPTSNVTSRMSPAQCLAILFYARHCQFSVLVAPHYNALARIFPDIKIVAVDAFKVHSFNAQFGIVGVPTILFFHNGRAAIKYNESDYTLEMFAKFITTYTGLESKEKLVVTSADFKGPVPSVMSNETDYYLAMAWFFISLCGVYLFSESSWWQLIKETILNTWRETEAHHDHSE